MAVEVYGFPAVMPLDIDFVNYSNEDIGFTASLTTAASVHAFAIPFPASLDLFDETYIIHSLEALQVQGNGIRVGTTGHGLSLFLSMLDEEFSATFIGTLADTDDAEFKAQFAGPMYFGTSLLSIAGATSVEGNQRAMDTNVIAHYFPPIPIDCLTPCFAQFVKNSQAVTLATNAVAVADYTIFEQVALRVWFTIRNLTAAEKSSRNMSVRFQRLDS